MTKERLIELIEDIRKECPDIDFEHITALELAKRAALKEIPIKKRRFKDTFFCTSCNTRVKLSDQYCHRCGRKFTMDE